MLVSTSHPPQMLFRESDLSFNSKGAESCWSEILQEHKPNMIVGCIYRHPSSNLDNFISQLENLISSLHHTYIHTYVIDHSPLGLFRANETNNWNEFNRLRIPTGRRQTSWLCTSAAEELNKGLPRTNSASGQSGTWTRDLQISSPAL